MDVPLDGSILTVKGEFQRSMGFHAATADPALQTEEQNIFTKRQESHSKPRH